jgi:uncharacterized protein YciI
MKHFFLIAGVTILFVACGETPEVTETPKAEEPESMNAQFDPKLAEKLGADDYGMKNYVMAFLKVGPNRDQDSATAAQIQRAHLDNINRLVAEKKMIVAGPFLDDTDIRGIFIFNVSTIEEAEALTLTDPAVKAGRLIMELHPWYGSAALVEIPKMHKKVSRNEI